MCLCVPFLRRSLQFSVRVFPYFALILATGAGHIKFWKMARTFTGLKLMGMPGRFGKTEMCDILGFIPLPDGKVLIIILNHLKLDLNRLVSASSSGLCMDFFGFLYSVGSCSSLVEEIDFFHLRDMLQPIILIIFNFRCLILFKKIDR